MPARGRVWIGGPPGEDGGCTIGYLTKTQNPANRTRGKNEMPPRNPDSLADSRGGVGLALDAEETPLVEPADGQLDQPATPIRPTPGV